MRLENKVAIVTGSAQGIGKAIAARMAAEGASVMVADIDSDLGLKTTRAIIDAGGRAIFKETDVADKDAVEAMLAKTIAEFGKVDVLVNNAGIIIRDTVLDTSVEDWNRVFAVNVNGTFYSTVAVAKHMAQRGEGGHIINLASPNGLIGAFKRSCYAATKGAIMAYTRCCAVEFAPLGIQVNALAPGFTETEINKHFFTEAVLNSLQFRVAINRVAQPDEIAKTAVALAAGDMPYMIGQILYLDGGWTACDIDYEQLGLHLGQ